MAQVDNTTVAVTAPVSLTTAESQVAQFTVGGNPPSVGVRTTPWALIEVAIPNVTGLATTASVTVNIRSGTTSAGTLLGSATATNGAAGAGAVGGVSAMALIPTGTDGAIFVGALTSSSTGTMAASATAPIIVTALLLD